MLKQCNFECEKCKERACNKHADLSFKKQEIQLPEDFIPELYAPEGNNEISYGIAFDIGTTTVAGMLWNLSDGLFVDAEARINYQSRYGSDIITRIQFSLESENNLSTMRDEVVRCLNDIVDEICNRNKIRCEQIVKATVVGNTVMSHLFLGVSPVSLSRAPFEPVFTEARDICAGDIGLGINANANIHLLPNIAAQVGSDITGVIIATRLGSIGGTHLAIDIGTNGEIVATKEGRLVCCSTAAGPAFGGIAGLSGSSIIDTVAELLREEKIDKSGRLLTEDTALSQKDIRNVQMAKGAIYAGIRTLMLELDISVESVDSIRISGAFGNHINVDSAFRIGLLPAVNPEKVQFIGNASGVGSSMVLLSERECRNADAVAEKTEHLELSKSLVFRDNYIRAMSFYDKGKKYNNKGVTNGTD